MSPPPPRELFAARLEQARALRNLPGQQAPGLKMPLEKRVVANRVNRYDSQARGIDLDGLVNLAEMLYVPMAHRVADGADIADAVLILSKLSPEMRAKAITASLKVAAKGDWAGCADELSE